MKLIVGLGNPGRKYAVTRHNIGFETVDYLAEQKRITIAREEHYALTGFYFAGAEKILLAKPQTFMNNSGEAVAALMNYYDLTPRELLVVYDDVDLAVGRVRIRARGSAGSHNGMRSIIKHLGRDDFPRVRIGIGKQPPGWDLAAYVLAKFTPEEVGTMQTAVKNAARGIELYTTEDIAAAMNEVNRKPEHETDI